MNRRLSTSKKNISRRNFIKTTGLATGSLIIALHMPSRKVWGTEPATEQPWVPNAFVHIDANSKITVLVNQAEMGQGVYTALPMLVAEELDADWTTIVIESAPVTPAYHHKVFGLRLTGGSLSISSAWQQLRTAGAMARDLLVRAAADSLGVDFKFLRTERSEVIHDGSGRRVSYGSLVSKAALLPGPETVALKDPKHFTIIGTNIKRIEGPEKVTGKAKFSLDLKLPDMLTAVIAHPPVYDDKVKRYQADKALQIPGVIKVKQISSGIAVIAKDFWTAKIARDQLIVEWEEGPATGFSTTALKKHYRHLAELPGLVVEQLGEPDVEIAKASKTLEAIYECSYLAHAAMEPLSCIAHVKKGSCELWVGTQSQSLDQINVAGILGIKPEDVNVHGTIMGGAFGRRTSHTSDFVVDAVEVARDERVPIKTIWAREEDIQGGYYRPMFTHKTVAAINENGMPTAWRQRIVGQSIGDGMPVFENAWVRNGIDVLSVDGAIAMPYLITNRQIELHTPKTPIPVLWWRSVNHGQNAFAQECFLDEIAHAGGNDSLELRRKLLLNQPRHWRVLELAAAKANWGEPLQEGHAHGLATHAAFGSYVAQVAEVSITNTNKIIVHRVICAVDCGIAVNPLNIRAQIEGAIVFGLSAVLYGEIVIEDGVVEQSNFHNYPVLRMDSMPAIDVHIVKSLEHPGGIGEPGLPPIAPAIANAVFKLTGKRVRSLPIKI